MIRLRGITWTNPRGYLPLAAASAVWRAARPDVLVEWEQFPWYEFEERVIASLSKGDGTYDLIMFDHPWTGTLASQGWLTPWSELVLPEELDDIRSRTIAPSFSSYIRDEALWALPLDSACHAGLFRSDLLSASDLPTQWNEVESWAKAHRSTGNPYPLVLSIEGVLGCCLFLSMMNGLGYPAFADAASPVCDRSAAEEVLTLLKSLLAYAPPGTEHLGPWDIYQRFVESDDLMYSPSIFAYVNYFGQSGRNAHLRLAPVPGFSHSGQGTPILGGVGLGVATSCKQKEAATQVGEYLMSEAVQTGIFPQHHGQPSDVRVWRDPTVNAHVNGFYNNLASGMERAYIRPTYSGFHSFELSIGRALQKWWNGTGSLTDTLDAIHAV